MVRAFVGICQLHDDDVTVCAVLDGEEVHTVGVGQDECPTASVVVGEQAFAGLVDGGELAGVDGAGGQAEGCLLVVVMGSSVG